MAKRFEISTRLAAAPETVWAHCSSMHGVSRELRPWMRMSFPSNAAELVPSEAQLGKRLFRSWLFLFGVLPVDYDDITLVEFEPGRRFLERSTMATQRLWQHERVVDPSDGGTLISDKLLWVGRIPGAELAFSIVVPFLFRWRHRQLRKLFGAR